MLCSVALLLGVPVVTQTIVRTIYLSVVLLGFLNNNVILLDLWTML